MSVFIGRFAHSKACGRTEGSNPSLTGFSNSMLAVQNPTARSDLLRSPAVMAIDWKSSRSFRRS